MMSSDRTEQNNNDAGDSAASSGTATQRSYRPELSPATVTRLTRDLFGLHVLTCRELDSYGDRNFHVSVDVNAVHNDHVPQVCPHGYVLKVLNSLDSRRPDIVGE